MVGKLLLHVAKHVPPPQYYMCVTCPLLLPSPLWPLPPSDPSQHTADVCAQLPELCVEQDGILEDSSSGTDPCAWRPGVDQRRLQTCEWVEIPHSYHVPLVPLTFPLFLSCSPRFRLL